MPDKEVIENIPENIPEIESSEEKPKEEKENKGKKATSAPKKTETILIPKGERGAENFMIFTINGKRWKVMRGVPVEVPKEVAEVYKHSLKQLEEADRYIDSVENDVR